jgi:hypothetical protein
VSRYALQVADALAATRVHDSMRFAWKGRLSPPVDPPLKSRMNDAACRKHLLTTLAERLRTSWYCHGRAIAPEPGEAGRFVADQALIAELSAANLGHGTWQPGWTVERMEDGLVVGTDGTFRARIPVGDCRPAGGPLCTSAPFAVRLPKEMPFYSPGFHMMLGDADLDLRREQVRVYWNVTASGAAQLVRALTSRLNAMKLPFELKVAAHPRAFRRCDAAVLYLSPEPFLAARDTLVRVAGQAQLQAPVPALTYRLAPGVGLAEDVRDGPSFGTHRCALLAEAILRAHEEGLERLPTATAHFADAGLALDAPYLEPALDGRHVL